MAKTMSHCTVIRGKNNAFKGMLHELLDYYLSVPPIPGGGLPL
jgi:hypothetical protein